MENKQEILRRQVLVVDDESVNRQLLGFIVSRDFDVLYAENGREALEIIREKQKTLSLVLLDLLMPELDGWGVLETMQNDDDLRRIPVIVLTSEKEAEIRSLQFGAVDFIPKPYDMPEIILARVRRSIELAEDKIIIQEAKTDALTGLYSREFFYQYAAQYDRYYSDLEMDAIVVNVNRFHLVNELHGRSFGDRLLCAIAAHITDMLSETNGIACRAGSDTFYIYNAHREDCAQRLARCASELTAEMDGVQTHLRVGIYANADRSIGIEQRFDRANIACNKLRSNYASSLGFYDTAMHEKELYGERLIMEMDRALAEKQFVVFYQPKYNIEGDKPVLTSAEALIRWFHPEYGMVSPGAFIPLFEENGLIQKLDRYVWREAAAQIARWKAQYGRVIPVSVNVSRLDIYDPNLLDELREITASNGLLPREYLLEITESAYTDNSAQIIEKVAQLRETGFRIEMDDFGSGYSSLNMLSDLPIDALKMDMKFVRNICTKEKDCRMVELVIEIANFLGVPVIAEGVETEEQYLLLKKLGAEIIQGYYFSKPVPPADFDKLIEKEMAAC